jgi:N-hydroxyarylamine O-acetyltransferase
MDVEAYLRRIGYDGACQPSASCLRALHRRHLFTVPFENLDIQLGTPIRLEIPLLYDKVVVRGRGGFCYELNGLFCELLRAMGFQVEMLSARVRRDDGSFGPEFDHLLLKVRLDKLWLVDVGFGDCFVDPIAFHLRDDDPGNGNRYRVFPCGDRWQLLREDEEGQVPLYSFCDIPRQLSDYAEMCRFHQTSPESGFTQRWMCSKATADGRITLTNLRLIITRSGTREESTLTTEGGIRRCLYDQFGIRLPESAELWKLVGVSRQD